MIADDNRQLTVSLWFITEFQAVAPGLKSSNDCMEFCLNNKKQLINIKVLIFTVSYQRLKYQWVINQISFCLCCRFEAFCKIKYNTIFSGNLHLPHRRGWSSTPRQHAACGRQGHLCKYYPLPHVQQAWTVNTAMRSQTVCRKKTNYNTFLLRSTCIIILSRLDNDDNEFS